MSDLSTEDRRLLSAALITRAITDAGAASYELESGSTEKAEAYLEKMSAKILRALALVRGIYR